MRSRLFMVWAAARWLLLMFVIAPGVEAPLVAHADIPYKPIKVWMGLASWYGRGFEGRKTANGEKYDSSALTAAHPSLPFGSLVRVVDPRTGRHQLVRINDRGPYQNGREMDMSYRAAQKLGLDRRGVAWVRFELIEVPPRR
jgi:rare lipoprotein A (peptidoglycan hydrolase)